MRLQDKHIDRSHEIASNTELEGDRGKPDVGSFTDVDEEQWKETMAQATIREAIRELLEVYVNEDGRSTLTHPNDLLADDNIDTIYFSQQPWRPPFMAIELHDCPDWAQITVGKKSEVRTKPGLSTDPTVVYFQVREGL